jgi:methyl-accepting chemotaxis protein
VEEQAAATREITNSVQQVTITTSTAAAAMREVLSIVEGTDAGSLIALRASEVVGRTAETLRSEVRDFVSAVSRGDDSERRLYERIPGGGADATLQIAGRTAERAAIRDIARGGIALMVMCTERVGTDVATILPGGGLVKARIVRNTDGVLSLAFRQDTASLAHIDRAMQTIGQGSDLRAA